MCLILTPFVFGAENAQLVQTNLNVQNSVDATNAEKLQPDVESATSSVNVQQEILSVNQDATQTQPIQPIISSQSQPQLQSQPQPQPQPQSLSQQAILDARNIQLLKEANAQYQYQINSRYEEKTRPVYDNEPVNSHYVGPYSYANFPPLPYYKENNQYQELGNGQRRAETNLLINDGMKSQYENQDQSTYTHQRSQSFSEYGKGELSPDYNTYTYKRTYY